MGEGTEFEDRVDLDEENYMEETEDDAEEDLEDDAGDAHGEEIAEEDCEELKEEGGQRDQSPDTNKNIGAGESSESEQKPSSPVNEAALPLSLVGFQRMLLKKILGTSVNLLAKFLRSEIFCCCLLNMDSFNISSAYYLVQFEDKDTCESKGFAFVSFRSKEDAQKAIQDLQSKEFKGKTLRCSHYETKNRLFIGNLPKNSER